MTVREFFPGVGQAVAERTILRDSENWGDVARRVAIGNTALIPGEDHQALERAIADGRILLSGRHLQHGDVDQPLRNMEVFTNCLEGSTRILTMEYGPIEIDKISGETITVISGDGQPRPAKINAHGEQDVFDITFRQNTTGPTPGLMPTVRATTNHRWLLVDGTITDSLKVGDVIAAAPTVSSFDPQAVVHGLIFGDGSAHKGRRDHSRPGISQGRTYASLRVCKQDSVRDEIHLLMDEAGYKYTTPPHADGDRCYYVGKFEHAKDVPFTKDPTYLAGFIYGWWLADGHKGINHALEISTADADAAHWLRDHAAYAGYVVTSHRVMDRKEGDGSFANGKPLHVLRIRTNLTMKVQSITPAGKALVYCPEEPVTSTFVLANGLLTGNCSTASQRALVFYLLLNGSGVGTSYDDDMCAVDWSRMPEVIPVVRAGYPDPGADAFPSLDEVKAEMEIWKQDYVVFTVPDSREGWAEAVQAVEDAAFTGDRRVLIIDFSEVRPKGSPIGGMQSRPSSGPVPLMQALRKMDKLRGSRMPLWLQAMTVDHLLAEIVLVGGARRSARIAVKWWEDTDIIDFINVKQMGGHWTANNSIGVDARFWSLVKFVSDWDHCPTSDHRKAWDVFQAATNAQYRHGTGEPGFLNLDLISRGETPPTPQSAAEFNSKYRLSAASQALRVELAQRAAAKPYFVIVNPCGEIRLTINGGYCVEGQTRILHKAGYDRIIDLVGKTIEVFNGEEWSAVQPFQTGSNQPLVRVTMSDGSYLDCTPEHRFSVRCHRQLPKHVEKRAHELVQGDILPTFHTPEDIEGEHLEDAYTYGAFLGDGHIERRSDTGTNRYELCLYKGKHHLPVSGAQGSCQQNGGTTVNMSHLDKNLLIALKGDHLPDRLFQLDRESTLQFVLGWLDTDGTAHKDTGGVSLTAASEQRARGLQLLLRRLGFSFVSAKKVASAGEMTNFGERKLDLWQVYVPESEAGLLQGYRVRGSNPVRLERVVKQPRVVSVEPLEGLHDTFCFTEPKRGMGVFNNVLTYQCVIGDVAVANCSTQEEFEEAVRLTTRALIRTNTMPALYQGEVKRTNRIGVSLTGIHEYAWQRFGLTFRDLIEEHEDEDSIVLDANFARIKLPADKTTPFWHSLQAAADVVRDEALAYSKALGVEPPITSLTIKPAGTTSKLFGLSEGAHLPSMREYLRWVQFAHGDPLIDEYASKGYPVVRELKTYHNVSIVGFPTRLAITEMMGDKVVTAAEATPEEQTRWLRLLETFWLGTDGGNQISYTLKYDPKVVTEAAYKRFIMENVPLVRAVSVMPQIDATAYEYQPEQPISAAVYDELMATIERVKEDVGLEHVDCSSGACPVDFKAA